MKSFTIVVIAFWGLLFGCTNSQNETKNEECSKGLIYHRNDIKRIDTSGVFALFIKYSDIAFGGKLRDRNYTDSVLNSFSKEVKICSDKYNRLKEEDGLSPAERLFKTDSNKVEIVYYTKKGQMYYRNVPKKLIFREQVQKCFDMWEEVTLTIPKEKLEVYADSLKRSKSFFTEYYYTLDSESTIVGYRKLKSPKEDN